MGKAANELKMGIRSLDESRIGQAWPGERASQHRVAGGGRERLTRMKRAGLERIVGGFFLQSGFQHLVRFGTVVLSSTNLTGDRQRVKALLSAKYAACGTRIERDGDKRNERRQSDSTPLIRWGE